MGEDHRSRFRRVSWWVVGLSAASGVVAVLGVYALERWSFDPHEIVIQKGTEPSDPFRKVRIPGVDRPVMTPAARSKLGSEERVIGFVIAGRARAYRLDALRHRTRHVVNDLVGDVPLSVTYCDIDDCVRGYTGTAGHDLLGISIAGLFENREMILEVDGQRYFQRSGQAFETSTGPAILPRERIEPTLTTWASWKRDHPDTDVYEGGK